MFSNHALRKLVLPLFLDQILLFTVTITATMLLSYAGEAAFSGVSLVDMINMLMVTMLASLATGGAVVVSQYVGMKDQKNTLVAASQLITATAAISVVVTLIVVLFYAPILRLLFGNVDASVMASATLYFIVSSLSYPFLALYNSGAALFRCMGNSKVPMTVSLLMNVLNVTGNAIAIFTLHTGVAGVAVATLLSRFLGGCVMLYLSANQENAIHIKLSEILSWNPPMIKRILKIAVPNGIENGSTQLGRVLLVSIIALFGTTQISANGVTNSLGSIALSFAMAMNLAIVPVVGQCVGAGNFEEAKKYIEKLMKITYVITLVISLVQIITLPWLLNLYSLSDEARKIATTLILIHNLSAIFFWPTAFTLPNALRAAGDAKFTMYSSIGGMFIIRIFFAYILGVVFKLGVVGVWSAMCIDWVFRSAAYIWRYQSEKWTKFKVI
ncbi:MAG TPA: MATE family efflux transporter [Erysipelotrichaceae bacterium]|nr:MATE family efflux transporter [Erysipelotrichaceae bacterium]